MNITITPYSMKLANRLRPLRLAGPLMPCRCLKDTSSNSRMLFQLIPRAFSLAPPTWVALPRENYPARPDLRKKYEAMRRPVCRMLQSLYGHPDSGTNWELYADEGSTRAGFVPVSKEWQ